MLRCPRTRILTLTSQASQYPFFYARILKVCSFLLCFYCCYCNWQSKPLCEYHLTLTPFYNINKCSSVLTALIGARIDP